jgi:CO dehydrogenase/acetyl-CoA synthase beta subunit
LIGEKIDVILYSDESAIEKMIDPIVRKTYDESDEHRSQLKNEKIEKQRQDK